LDNGRFSDGKISFNESLNKIIAENIIKPTLGFTPLAWLKILQLVQSTSTEIGWHGIVTRTPETGLYLIEDIVIYPQTVTGANVTTDDKEYGTWLQNFDDDTFNKIRYQGHSHVNFAVSPSGVDQNFYDSILQQMQEGDYYIFMIINKKSDINVWIYDFAQNIIFDKEDISLKILYEDTDVLQWIQNETKAKVKTHTYVQKPVAATSNYEKYWEKNKDNPIAQINNPKDASITSFEEDNEMDDYYTRTYGTGQSRPWWQKEIESHIEKRGPGRPPKGGKK
jgi:hypothetical protein